MTPEKLDTLIIEELAKDPGTLLELSIRMHQPTSALLPRLQLLGGLKRVQCVRDEDDRRFLWELTDQVMEEVDPVAPAHETPTPVHETAPLAHTEETTGRRDAGEPAPKAARVVPGASLTDRIIAFVADRGLASTAHVIAGFPEANTSSVYSLLSQLAVAGRLVRMKMPGKGATQYRVPEPGDRTPAPRVDRAAKAPAPAPDPRSATSHGMVLSIQDADFASLLKIGKVVIRHDPKIGVQITVSGFDFGEDGSCRQQVARALHWTRELIDAALSSQLLVPGGCNGIVVGVD